MEKKRMRFIEWLRQHPDDFTKIAYVFKDSDGREHWFTSEDDIARFMIKRIWAAWVESVEYVSNEFSTHWLAKLYEE